MPLNYPPAAINIQQPIASSATASSVTASSTVSSIAAANTNRRGMTLLNTGVNPVFIDVVNTVTTSVFQYRLDPLVLYEMPSPTYTGAVFGITAATLTSSIMVREFLV
jgi:hypothetical protein